MGKYLSDVEMEVYRISTFDRKSGVFTKVEEWRHGKVLLEV